MSGGILLVAVHGLHAERVSGMASHFRRRSVIGDVSMARALGCETMLGVDPRSRFDEPSAPEEGFLQLKAITRCYLIAPSVDPKPGAKPSTDVRFPHAAFVTGWKDGVRMVNMMPTLPGKARIEQGYEECMRKSGATFNSKYHQVVPDLTTAAPCTR